MAVPSTNLFNTLRRLQVGLSELPSPGSVDPEGKDL